MTAKQLIDAVKNGNGQTLVEKRLALCLERAMEGLRLIEGAPHTEDDIADFRAKEALADLDRIARGG